jgi:dihydrofolate synthase/folylpolyglutamate synthase
VADHAISADPRVQAQLDRLASLSPGADILGLDRITRLLERIGDPHLRLPPVFHVAGTNGKGSTCSFLRAALEADGRKVHVYTSPHLVRFNERIRIASQLVDDDVLAEGLRDVLDRGEDIGASFFEVTTALAFRLFADIPADACILEVGLGGRLDATNVVPEPAICGIAQLALDHQSFLGANLPGIAREKAGIAKPGVPIAMLTYATTVADAVREEVAARGGYCIERRTHWDVAAYHGAVHYRDSIGHLTLAEPNLAGQHQLGNLGLAMAMLRHQSALHISESALKAAPRWAQWPARLQRLEHGPLLAPLPETTEVWLDGGHNPAAGEAIANYFTQHLQPGEKLAMVMGMLSNKDVAGFLKPLLPLVSAIHSVPVERHDSHGAEAFAELAAEKAIPHQHHATIEDAIAALASSGWAGPALIAGSLYLAGEVLGANDQLPV